MYIEELCLLMPYVLYVFGLWACEDYFSIVALLYHFWKIKI